MIEEDRSWVIYKHTNKINGKVYIGMTCHIETRFGSKNGQGYLRKNKKGEYIQPHIANAIVKYGWDNFDHEILESNLTLEEANKLEVEYIEKYDSLNPEKGYNIREGGSHGKLGKSSIEKLKKAMEGRYDGEKNPFYGKKHSEESLKVMREKQKENAKKRDFSGENNPMYGRVLTEEERYKRGNATRGKARSEETKKKISEKLKKNKDNDSKPKRKMPPRESKYRYICIETGEVFDRVVLATEKYNVSRQSIFIACRENWRTCCGYHWKKELKEEYKESQNN